MKRALALIAVTLAFAHAPASHAQTSTPPVLVDTNGTVFGRILGYSGAGSGTGTTWASMDNGPVSAVLSFGASSDGTVLNFLPLQAKVYFSASGCAGTTYIVNLTPGAATTALVYNPKSKVLLYVADQSAAVQATFSSYLQGGHCYGTTPPGNVQAFKASAPPLNLAQYYVPPFIVR